MNIVAIYQQYPENINNLKNGDQLICCGISSLSRKIRWFQGLRGAGEAKKCTHAATYHSESFERSVAESTTFNAWADKKGFQENLFKDWLIHYNGDVYARHLYYDRSLIYDSLITQTINSLLKDKIPYESGIPGYLELLLCVMRLNRRSKLKQLHCTETNVIILQSMGLYDPGILANNMPPYTFWPGGDFENHLECDISGLMPLKIIIKK